MPAIRVIDSHTGGEPTRLVLEGGPDLGTGPLAARLTRFREEFDAYRSAIVNEPRGSDPLVGALLVKPHSPDCALGVIFFNNVGFLGMCGHGTIGMIAALDYAGELAPGAIKIDTPVGAVAANLSVDGRISVDNVVSYRSVRELKLEVPGIGTVVGDIAWGGNWFFLTNAAPCPLRLDNIPELSRAAQAIRRALGKQGITGADGAEVDHIEMFAPPSSSDSDSRNFVLCPGGAYDRSPCGTGTSAKLACLAADGKLRPGERWVQESIIGSRFEARYRLGVNGGIIPRISGRAFICSVSDLHRDVADPFCDGIGADP
jgi:4-hydroxyproline epimerase